MTKAAKARIEVFRTGTFTPMEGAAITYSAADLKAVADVYDSSTAPAPIVVGHPKVDAPAYGWVESFDYDASADRLYANVGEIDPAFSDAVKAGRYKKVSMSFFRPADGANPVPGTWYPRHVGFLGGAAPAVTGLKNVQFTTATDAPIITVDFGEAGFEQTAGLLRTLRDFLIEKFGLDETDKALPGYRIEWLNETEVEKPATRPAFSSPTKKESEVTKPQTMQPSSDPAFAAREADVSAREQRLAERERQLVHDDNVSFAESLVTEGKILPVNKDRLVSLLDALPSDASVSFAAGEASISVAQGLRDLLAAQPKVVSFGKIDVPENGPDRGVVAFSADGKAVDPEQLSIHEKALEYQRQHPGAEYLAAVRAVS